MKEKQHKKEKMKEKQHQNQKNRRKSPWTGSRESSCTEKEDHIID